MKKRRAPRSGGAETMESYRKIVERIEQVRESMGLNKSQFSARIGMKPQTYNNFVGSQGSKPNIPLVHGVVSAFGVNPLWLLSGEGSAFHKQLPPREGTTSPIPDTIPPRRGDTGQGHALAHDRHSILMQELNLVLTPYRQVTSARLNRTVPPNREVEHALEVLTRHFFSAPERTTAQVLSLLEEFEHILGEMEFGTDNPRGTGD